MKRISSSPPQVEKALNTNDLGPFLNKKRDKIGTAPEPKSLPDMSLYDIIQELSERKKMRLFSPLACINYRPCTLTEGKEWFISFYVQDPDTGKLKRIRMKLNRIKPVSARRKTARALMSAIDQRLALGWNPLIEARSPKAYMKLSDALDSFLKIKGKEMEENSMRSYRSFIKTFRDWLAENGYGPEAYVCSFNLESALSFMDDLEEDLSAKTYNNYVTFFRSLFNWMRSKGYIDFNPFDEIQKKSKRLIKKSRRILTDEELSKLIYFLQGENEAYLAMCLICYSCLIRPKEIAMLKCKDIDLQKQLIHVKPEVAKNDKDSFRTIPDDLVPILHRIDLSHPDWYLFGQHHQGDFSPGPGKICSRKIAQWWNLHVREACGFGMDLKFYSLKDTGITNMLDGGIPINVVQQQADHSSVAMTAIYVGNKPNAAEDLKRMQNFVEKKVKII